MVPSVIQGSFVTHIIICGTQIKAAASCALSLPLGGERRMAPVRMKASCELRTEGAFLTTASVGLHSRPQPCFWSWKQGVCGGVLCLENPTPEWCPGSQHALWPSVVDLKSVRRESQFGSADSSICLLICLLIYWAVLGASPGKNSRRVGRPAAASVSLRWGLKMPRV